MSESDTITPSLIDAAQAVVVRWDSPVWKDTEHTAVFVDRLRRSLAAERARAALSVSVAPKLVDVASFIPALPEPVATLHDDGYFTMPRGLMRDMSGRAGWRLSVWSSDQVHALAIEAVSAATQPPGAAAAESIRAAAERLIAVIDTCLRRIPEDVELSDFRDEVEDLRAALRAPVAPAAAGEARTDGAPAEIWLQLHGDGEPDGKPVDYTDEVSWCWHQVHEHDVRYVLAPAGAGEPTEPSGSA